MSTVLFCWLWQWTIVRDTAQLSWTMHRHHASLFYVTCKKRLRIVQTGVSPCPWRNQWAKPALSSPICHTSSSLGIWTQLLLMPKEVKSWRRRPAAATTTATIYLLRALLLYSYGSIGQWTKFCAVCLCIQQFVGLSFSLSRFKGTHESSSLWTIVKIGSF